MNEVIDEHHPIACVSLLSVKRCSHCARPVSLSRTMSCAARTLLKSVRSEPVNQTVGALNAYSSKMIKATEFKLKGMFGCSQSQSGHDTLKIFLEKGVAMVT